MNIPQNTNNGNMMEMIKTNLMTMTMMNSMNGNSNKENNNGMFGMIFIFIITGLIDIISKYVIPSLIIICKEYYNEKSNKLINIIDSSKNNIKSSSITIQVHTSDLDNVLGQALLDYITNNKNTKHISYEKKNFVLNQSDIIEISEDFFIKLLENKNGFQKKDDKDELKQTIEFFSYTKTMKELRSFLDKITHEYIIKIENKLGDKIYYFNQVPMSAPLHGKDKDFSKLPPNCIFLMKPFQTNRKFTNLFGPEISIVKKRVEFFINNKKWYDSKGIPYTLGLLLSGQAGAGKTSTIKCLANETKRHIININLNNDITKTQLENLFFNETILILNISSGTTEKYFIPLDQRIYVLEDIDCQGDLVLERKLKNTKDAEDTKDAKDAKDGLVSIKTNPNRPNTGEDNKKNDFTQAEKIDLSFLLNLLDGILEIPGRIIIMTSNYPKMLDHALIRPGRIDIIADFKKCNHNTIIEMIEFFYDIKLNNLEKNIIYNTQNEFFSPAEMGKIMFENFGNYKNVFSILENIVHETIVKETIVNETIVKETILNENIVNENIVKETIVHENIVNETIVNETIVNENIVNKDIVKETILNENVVNEDIVNYDIIGAKKMQEMEIINISSMDEYFECPYSDGNYSSRSTKVEVKYLGNNNISQYESIDS